MKKQREQGLQIKQIAVRGDLSNLSETKLAQESVLVHEYISNTR
jgi:hypothetical protein